MRYQACTNADIKLLRTRIVETGPDRPQLSDPCFYNVSIITSFNNHWDKINEIDSACFADETNQQLTSFYSQDK